MLFLHTFLKWKKTKIHLQHYYIQAPFTAVILWELHLALHKVPPHWAGDEAEPLHQLHMVTQAFCNEIIQSDFKREKKIIFSILTRKKKIEP